LEIILVGDHEIASKTLKSVPFLIVSNISGVLKLKEGFIEERDLFELQCKLPIKKGSLGTLIVVK
jgi:hypothetical protein